MAFCRECYSTASEVRDVSSIWYPAVGDVFTQVSPVSPEHAYPIPGRRSVRQKQYLSRVRRKPTFWFLTWSDTNQAVRPRKMARGLKFRIQKEDGLYFLCSENKGADQLRGFAKFSHMQNVCFLMTRLIFVEQFHSSIKERYVE